MEKNQLVVIGGQAIVDNNVHPFSKLPEPELEYASIAVAPALFNGDHLYIYNYMQKIRCTKILTVIVYLSIQHNYIYLVEKIFVLCEGSHSTQKPAVTNHSLHNVKSIASISKQLRVIADLLQCRIIYRCCIIIVLAQRRYETRASIRLIASAITLSVGR